jgi:hypothetical protein
VIFANSIFLLIILLYCPFKFNLCLPLEGGFWTRNVFWGEVVGLYPNHLNLGGQMFSLSRCTPLGGLTTQRLNNPLYPQIFCRDFSSLNQRTPFEGADNSPFTPLRLPQLCSHPRMYCPGVITRRGSYDLPAETYLTGGVVVLNGVHILVLVHPTRAIYQPLTPTK